MKDDSSVLQVVTKYSNCRLSVGNIRLHFQTFRVIITVITKAALNTKDGLKSWVLSHLQETAKNTSLPSLFDPRTLALSIIIYLFVFFFYIKNTLDPLSLALITACFFHIYIYINLLRVLRWANWDRHSTCILLLFCWFWLLLLSLWIKASANWWNVM